MTRRSTFGVDRATRSRKIRVSESGWSRIGAREGTCCTGNAGDARCHALTVLRACLLSLPFLLRTVGERLMRFLVLVAAWERQNLSEAIFCAIGVRVVDLMHRTSPASKQQ
jgi:hypothetical protein